jgi:DNA-binding SARP family transcriptional activator/TolB-like protein
VPRLITFGGLSVSNGTLPNGIGNPRSRLAILAVLAVAGERGIRREKLATMFWPESDEERARNALRQALFTLKRDIGADIATGATDVRLNPDVLTADVIEFEAAIREGRVEDAAALYAGPFLDGVYLRESPEFERWAEVQRNRLSAEFARALEKAAALASERGDLRASLQWWERRSTHDPLSGRVARLYMEALALAGEREKAIRHAAAYRDLVRQELEADPDPDVIRTAEWLRDAPASTVFEKLHQPSPPSSALANPPIEERVAAAPETPVERRHITGGRIAAATALLIACGVAATVLLRGEFYPPIQKGLVAIGEMENRTGDSATNALAEQLASDLTQLLSQSSLVKVIDTREPARAQPPSARGTREAARRVAAEYAVLGYLTGETDILAGAQIIDTRSGHVLFQSDPIVVRRSASGSRPASTDEDSIPINGGFREIVAGALLALSDTTFTLWKEGRSRPPRYSAYLEFLQGIDAFVQQGPPQAISHLSKAIALDPTFAQAKTWYLEQAIGRPREAARFDSVRQALLAERDRLPAYDRAAADRQLAFIDGRLEDTYTAARHMVELAPNSPDAKMLLAQASMATRRFREAINVLHQVRDRPMWFRNLGQRQNWDFQAHRLLGDAETGFAEWHKTVNGLPTEWSQCQAGLLLMAATGREASVDSLFGVCAKVPDARPYPSGMHSIVARIYRNLGNEAAADRSMRRAFAFMSRIVEQDTAQRSGLALLHFEMGEWQQAYDILRTRTDTTDANQRVIFAVVAGRVGDTTTARITERWLAGRSKRNGADMDRAFIQIALGEHDRAFESLRAAIEAGVSPGWNTWYLRPELAPLRNDPRFQELVRPR